MENNENVGTATTEEKAGVVDTEKIENAETDKVQVEEGEKKQEKLFTQKEVDEIVQKRLQRTKDKETDEDLRAELEGLKAMLLEKEQALSISNANIDEEYKDYVKYTVSKMVTKDKNFDTALKEYMQNEGKKFEKKTEVAPQKQTIKMSRPQNVGNEDEMISFSDALDKAMKIKRK